MIVLPVSSQVVYIINDNRYICYNDFENREIAKLILQGEYCEDLKLNYKNQIIQLEYINNNLVIANTVAKNTIDSIIYISNKYDYIIRKCSNEVDELNKSNKRKSNYLIGGGVIIILLTIINIL